MGRGAAAPRCRRGGAHTGAVRVGVERGFLSGTVEDKAFHHGIAHIYRFLFENNHLKISNIKLLEMKAKANVKLLL